MNEEEKTIDNKQTEHNQVCVWRYRKQTDTDLTDERITKKYTKIKIDNNLSIIMMINIEI